MPLKVFCTIGIQSAFIALTSMLEKEAGTQMDVSFGVATVFRKDIEDGAKFDAVILTRSILHDLVAAGRISSGSMVDVARSGLGLAVRQGAPKPEIASVKSLTRTLLDADSIASSSNGLAGAYFAEVISELGLSDQLKTKIKLDTSGGYAAELTARGETKLAVQLISEILPVRGVELVGAFPEAVQKYAVLSAGISPTTNHSTAANALLLSLRDPRVEATFASCGLERCA